MSQVLRVFVILWICPIVLAGEFQKPEKEPGVDAQEKFVKDIIKTWHLKSPTIIIKDDLLNLCMIHNWWLCLTNDKKGDELAIHLALIHKESKQDGLILMGNRGHRQIFRQLANFAPSIFTSNIPIFIAEVYISEIQLRLDSNIIFYRWVSPTSVKLFDKFRLSYGRWIYPKRVEHTQKKQERRQQQNQVARLKSLHIGDWNVSDGIMLQSSMNRWDRRVDLKGLGSFRNTIFRKAMWAYPIWDQTKNRTSHVCYKCMNHNQCKWKNGKKMPKRECWTSGGYFQEMLHYITDSLNLQVNLVYIMDDGTRFWARKYWPNEINYGGPIGYLQIRAADVESTGLGSQGFQAIRITDGQRGSIALPTNRAYPTLIAARPRNSHVQIWAYMRVFGITQWVVFISLLVGFVIVMTMTTSVTDMDVKDGSVLKIILSAISSAYLFTLQLGAHKTGNFRITTLTLSMLTMLLWAYYSCDITAIMTAVPDPPIPVNNFEDVLEKGYKVIISNGYFAELLKSSKNGSAQQRVFFKYCSKKLENRTHMCHRKNPIRIVSEDPKMLWFSPVSELVNINKVNNANYNGLILLDLDDIDKIYSSAALMLQPDSEFLQIFNYYIMKMMETGILKRIYCKYHNRLYVNEQFGMPEPRPLGVNNVLFLFSLLGAVISLAVGIAFVEYIVDKWHQSRMIRPMN